MGSLRFFFILKVLCVRLKFFSVSFCEIGFVVVEDLILRGRVEVGLRVGKYGKR